MKETLTDQWPDLKDEVIVDPEKGEFQLVNSNFKLVLQGDTALLMENHEIAPVCKGYFRGGLWRFEEDDFVSEDPDPLTAAIRLTCEVYQRLKELLTCFKNVEC